MNLIRPYLAIGSLRDTQDASLLARHAITALVSVAEPIAHQGIASFFVPFDDGLPLRAGDVQKVVAFVQAQKEAGGTTLLACALGVSRSASLAIAAIKETEAVDLMTAYCIVKRAPPRSAPAPRFVAVAVRTLQRKHTVGNHVSRCVCVTEAIKLREHERAVGR